MVAFPAPASSNAACRCPALRSPDRFTPRVMWPGLAFPLPSIAPLRSCREGVRRQAAFTFIGLFIMSPLPSSVGGRITTSRAPSLRRRYPLSSLLRTHPTSSRRRLISRCRRLYSLPFSEGCLGARRISPVAQHVLVTVLPLPPRRRVAPSHANAWRFLLPSPKNWGLGLRGEVFRGHVRVHFRCGPVTHSPSLRRLCR